MPISRTFRVKFFLGLALASLVIAGSAPTARANDTIIVSAHGLDLRGSGEATLRHRVRVAAYTLCGQDGALGSDAFGNCVQEALRSAAPQVQALVAAARANRQIAASGH